MRISGWDTWQNRSTVLLEPSLLGCGVTLMNLTERWDGTHGVLEGHQLPKASATPTNTKSKLPELDTVEGFFFSRPG